MEQKIKIWLDDIRPMPSWFTHWCKTPEEAITLLDTGNVEEISFDHDLGFPEPRNGHMVAMYIEGLAYFNKIPRLSWRVHSANPVGERNIQLAMISADRFWQRNERVAS